MVTGCSDQPPGDAAVGRKINAGSTATQQFFTRDVYNATAIAMGRGSGADPRMTAIVGEHAIERGVFIIGKIASCNNEGIAYPHAFTAHGY